MSHKPVARIARDHDARINRASATSGRGGGRVGSRRSATAQLQGAVELTSRSVSSSWKPGPLRCEVTAGAFTIAVDEPESVGGTGAAPQPTDLLLVSLASCFTLALAHSAGETRDTAERRASRRGRRLRG